MGFHDHLYPSNYYNEEELLSSDEYPPPLVNICARYCVNHLSKTLIERIPVVENEPIEPQIADADAESEDERRFRLRDGVRLPSELTEKIFAYLDKHTTSAELLRSGENSGSSSSSSSSGASSSSEDEDVGGRGGGGGAGGNRGRGEERAAGENNVMVLVGGGQAGNNMEEDVDEFVLQELQQRRREILRRGRRRRRRRREDVRRLRDGGGGGGLPRIGGVRRKRKMLWNGCSGDDGRGGGSEGGGDEEQIEVVGFDAIVGPLFGNPSHLPLTKVNLRTSTAVTDELLRTLMAHRPRELDIHECPKLTSASLETINANSDNLIALTIGTTTQVLPSVFPTRPLRQGFLVCPKLLKLVIWNLNTNLSLYWGHLTASFTVTLTSADLSGCGEFEDFEFLRKLTRLRSLVLYNVLISGRVDDDDTSGRGNRRKKKKKKKKGEERGDILDEDDDDDNDIEVDDEEEDDDDRDEDMGEDRHVVVLNDEEEGQRVVLPAGEGEGAGGGAAAADPQEPADHNGVVGYYQQRKRLEKLVNKLVAPICELKELRHLDISTSSDPSSSSSLHASPNGNNLIGSVPSTPWSTYPNPNLVLSTIVQNLPKLSHLDISGTNLAGRGVAVLMRGGGNGGGGGDLKVQGSKQEKPHHSPPDSDGDNDDDGGGGDDEPSRVSASSKLCDIPGLNSRVDNPLEFLGLYGTAHDASHRHCIPAKRISGDKDEGQILVACEAYIHRHEVLEKVLNDLFHLFRSERGTHITQSLRLILRAMNLHPSEKHVQISGSASLFYIVKNELHNQGGAGNEEVINPPMKRMILSTIVNAMAIHKVDSTMARNGCLTICHFRIPQDVMFIYAKLVKILLKILGQSIGPNQRHETFVERIAIYLLNSLACQVEGWHKRLVGDLGAMKRMLQLIRDRLSQIECDDVMEIAWSTMWNVTDETPENCEKFLKNEGMVLFLKCLQTFPNKPELLRNMMGLLGNVAEVGALRRQLMTSEFISVFCELLDSTQDNIEVSYNAAGVLAHILSDGAEAWGIASPPRSVIQESMVRNVNRWNINSNRNINYRSFEPILRLLKITHTRECQLWASWALANLTRVYPEKYVPLVEKEHGLGPLRELLEEPLSPSSSPSTIIQQDVKKYARITLRNVDEFNSTGHIDLTSFLEG